MVHAACKVKDCPYCTVPLEEWEAGMREMAEAKAKLEAGIEKDCPYIGRYEDVSNEEFAAKVNEAIEKHRIRTADGASESIHVVAG